MDIRLVDIAGLIVMVTAISMAVQFVLNIFN